MNISLICACKNRYKPLRVSLTSWLLYDEIKEIIIVDWDSEESLNHLSEIDDRIKIVTVSDQKYFNQPQPLNIAASLATQEYILKADCDYTLNPYHNFFENYSVNQNNFVSGHHDHTSPEYIDPKTGRAMFDKTNMSTDDLLTYVNSYSHFFKYLTGMLLVSRENFIKVGGYNENFGKYYAFEDDEICDRLKLLGLEQQKIKYDYNWIHIPHPDKKRFENFEGFYETGQKEELESLENGPVKWQTEYYFSQCHVNENKKMFSNPKEYFVDKKTKWNIQQIDDQHYYAEKIYSNKLFGFPTAYYMSLEESEDRRKNLENQFSEYGIKLNPIISKRFDESDDVVTGKYVHQLNDGTKGCAVSHLKAVNHWYKSTNEEYAFFFEDDLSLETVDFWDFTWNEFVEKLPSDWECVQLLTVRNNFDTFELRERYWDDWGASAYILKRDYAKKIIDNYCQENSYHLEIPNTEVMPLIENILFTTIGKTYTVPLFVENIRFQSTFVGKDDDVDEGQKNNHNIASKIVLDWWKSKSKKTNSFSIKVDTNVKTEIEELLIQYSLDTENPILNFNVALWYEERGHNAAALSYFLRCAERADDKLLAYEALIHGSNCYDRQGTRDGTSKGILQQAMCLYPERPEARFLLSRFSERRQWWQDCYIYASEALDNCDFECEPLKTDVEYPGKYGLLYEKAISSWWWGKIDDTKKILIDLKNNYEINRIYSDLINDHLKNFCGEVG